MLSCTPSTVDLSLSCALLAAVVRHANHGVVVLDDAGQIVEWNEWMVQRAECAEAQVLGQDFWHCFPESRGGRLQEAVQGALSQGCSAVLSYRLNPHPLPLYAYPRSGSEVIPQAIAVRALSVQGQRFCLIEISDVSAAIAREDKLRERAQQLLDSTYLDGLTGIPNRRRLDEFLPTEFRRAARHQRPISLLMVDVDFFKRYNDFYGHQAGDTCLRDVAQAIRGCVARRAGDLVARYGGEEFVVVLPETTAAAALALANRVRDTVKALALPHADSEVADYVTVSVGVATQIPEEHSHQHETLVAAADFALYCAKSAGRDCVEVFAGSAE